MKRVSILAFILTAVFLLNRCNGKSKSNDQNTTQHPQRSEASKAMDSDLLPENGGKKLPMF